MRFGTTFWGIAVVLLGVLLLLDTAGVLRFNWAIAAGAFLVALGGWLLWARRNRPVAVAKAGERMSLPLDGAARAAVQLRHGAGRLTVRGGTGPGLLFDGSFAGGLDLHSHRRGDLLEADMRPSQARSGPSTDLSAANGSPLDWNVSLSDAVPMSLAIETGAGEGELDLSRLRLTDLTVKSGAGAVALTLPGHAGHTAARLEAGASSLDVVVPETAAARIRVDGLGAIRVDAERFPRRGSSNESPGFDSAINCLDIRVGVGLGSVTVH